MAIILVDSGNRFEESFDSVYMYAWCVWVGSFVAEMALRSCLSKARAFFAYSPSHRRPQIFKSLFSLYSRYLRYLFACRHVTARILAEESLEGQEAVFAVTMLCLVLQAVIVVQKESRAPTGKRHSQVPHLLLLDFLAARLIDIKLQQRSLKKKLG